MSLQAHLDTALPRSLVADGPTAVFVCGWASAPSGIESLSLLVDGQEQPLEAFGAPRLDVYRALHPELDPFAGVGPADGYRSGFWGMARVWPRAGTVSLGVRARLGDGEVVERELASIPVVAPEAPVALDAPADGPLVAVAMATYEPPLDLLRAQLDTIRAQTHANWVCVISDDGTDPGRFAEIEALVAGDPRFSVSRAPERLGFYRNFERALTLVPPEADFVALADQDDAWHPDKLATLLREIGSAALAYSDARVVAETGEVVSETYWVRRLNNHDDLLSLLVANAVTGAASLLRRDLLDVALPFPPGQFAHFHDHWLALCARCLGPIAYVDRPLYDYVQHGEAELGHARANRIVTLRSRLDSLRRDPRERVRLWRMIYFVDLQRLMQVATILRDRLGNRIGRRERRVLDRFLALDRSAIGPLRLLARAVRELLRRRPETLGAELVIFYALVWRRLLSLTTRERPVRGLRLDAVPPPALDPKPGSHGAEPPVVRDVATKIAPLAWAARGDAPVRVNLLIPTMDLEHFFGGYIGKLNLAARLAERGHRVRIVTVDPVGPLPKGWQRRVEGYAGLQGVFDRVEVAFGRETQHLEVSRDDAFVATTWWTAYIAADALRTVGAERFLYLIQEYEPFTFPMGTYAALAAESYELPHTALFSTELLRDYFRRHGVGVFAPGSSEGDAISASFQNAITAVEPPSAADLRARTQRRLLFYARPEPHAARNMFELGVLALNRALRDGAFAGWSLHGIGTVNPARRLELGAGRTMELLPRSAQGDYASLLRDHDVGLSLMYTPHPSLVPIEMASAGMLTVTNSFENKTPEALRAISENLVVAPPTVGGVAAALREAADGAGDAERRARGAAVRWSRDWATSFDDALLERVEGLLRR